MSLPQGFNAPPIPVPTSINDIVSKVSESLVVSNNPVNPLYIHNNTLGGYRSLLDFPYPLDPPFPNGATIQFIVYWERLYYDIIAPDQSFSKTITHTAGMSKTDSETLSAEVGVEYGGLSAKLTATIGQSVTISEETEISNTYNLTPKAGEAAVMTIWCLVEKYTFLHGEEIINWSGKAIGSNPINNSANWIYSLPNTSKLNRTEIIQEKVTYFPST